MDAHDMIKLQKSVLTGVDNNASDDVIAEADSLFKRLEVELGDINQHNLLLSLLLFTVIISLLHKVLSWFYIRFKSNTELYFNHNTI